MTGRATLRGRVRSVLALERDVLVLSVAMFAFSLGFQMTTRYLPRYMSLLGAGAVAIGLFGTLEKLLGAIYPYPGGLLSDRIGTRRALVLFGLVSTAGFLVWLAAPVFGVMVLPAMTLGPLSLEADLLPIGVFLGLILAQTWKSFGLGATFALVKQSVAAERLATGFASTETVRRLAFFAGPLLAGALIAVFGFDLGFGVVLAVAAGTGAIATLAQQRYYRPSGEPSGETVGGLSQLWADLRAMPAPLPPLLAGDTLVRFGNGMVHVFTVIVVTELRVVGLTVPGVGRLSPEAYFGLLLAIEMAVALVSMVPVARVADRVGLKPVVALGFAVYALFPALLIFAPADPLVYAAVFAFSGLRFAGLPAHKALIVGPAESAAGGRTTGAYYLVRNTVVVPSALVGGTLWAAASPEQAFTLASLVGLAGVGVFLAFGERFETTHQGT
jgi:MFS family permease